MKSIQLHRVLFALVALCLPAFATDVYVAQNAVGSGNGTSCGNAESLATFNAATLGAGTVYHGCSGTWTATQGASGFVSPSNGGTSGNPVTLIFDQGATTITAPYWGGPAINTNNVSWLVINGDSNLTIQASANGTAESCLTASATMSGATAAFHCTSGTFSSYFVNGAVFSGNGFCIGASCTGGYNVNWTVTGGGSGGTTMTATSSGTSGLGASTTSGTLSFDYGECVGNGSPAGNATNVTIENLTCANLYVDSSLADNGGEDTYGLDIWNTSNLVEQNNTIHDTKWATRVSYQTGSTYSGLTITGNNFYNIDHGIFVGDSSSSGSAVSSNWYLYANTLGSMTNWDNTADNNHHDWIHLSTNSTTSRFSSIYVYNNSGIGDIGANANGGFFSFPGGPSTMSSVYFFNNLYVNTSPTHHWANGFISWYSAGSLTAVNNTFVSSYSGDNFLDYNDGSTGLVFENNVIDGSAANAMYFQSSTYSTIDYQDYFSSPGWTWNSTSTTTFATWKGSSGCNGCDSHSILTNPNLNGSYEPNPGSPLISNGANLYTLFGCSSPVTPGLGAGCNDLNGSARSNAAFTIGAYNAAGTPTASTPSFLPAGGSYRGTQTVSISAATGPVICWNTTGAPATNGTTGCTTGTLYTGAITVSATETLYAIAGGTGYLDGSIASATYTINAATRFIPIYGYLTSTAAPTSIAPGVDGAIVPAIQSAVDNTTCSAGPPITCPLSYSWTTPTGYINNWTGLGANGCAATLRGNSGESCSVGLNMKSVANGSANSSAPAYIGTQLAADFACQQNLFQPTFTYYVGQCFYASSHYFYISNPNTNGSCVSGSSTPNPGDSTSGSCSIHDNGTTNAPPQDFAFESSYGDAPVWATGTAYTAGTVEWNTAGGNNFFYVAQANCTSGSGPTGGTWNTTQGGTTNDNGGTGGCNWTTEKTVVMNVNTSVRDSANDPATSVPYYMSGIPFIWETTWRYFQDAFYSAGVQNYASTPLAFVRAGGGTGEEQSTHAIQAMENNWFTALNDTQMETLWIYAVEEKEQNMANTWNAISPVPLWHMEELVNGMTSLSNGGGTDMAPANAYIRNVFSLATLGGNCSAPTYLCNSLSTATVQTPAAPFNTTTLTNSTALASEFANNTILRVTDPNTGGGVCGSDNQFNISHSQGSNDVDLNTTSTLIVVTCAGNTNYFLGMNPNAGSFAVFPAPPATLFNCSSGPVGFSRVNQLVAYCLPINGFSIPGGGTANGSTVYKITFSLASGTNLCGLGVGNCPDPSTQPTWSAFYDFRNCSQATNAAPVSASIFGVAPGDAAISLAMSWTGGQGTAHLFFQYVPGVGCYTLDTVGNGTNPVWYTPSGTPTTISSVACSFSIHDAFTYGTYASVQIASGTQSGSGCGAGDGSPIWQVATSNLIMYSTQSFVGGHFTMTPSYYFSFPDPQFYRSTLASPSTNVQVAAVNCAGVCQDAHINGDATSDTNPILGTTGGTANATWSGPYKSEVIAYATNGTGSGTIWRITHTYSTGTAATSFPAEYGIGVPSQDRKLFCWTSDMLGNLGTTSGGLNRWDVFCVNLTSGDLGATPPFIGYGSNGLSTKDLNNILTPFCAVSTPTGCYGTSYCSNNWCSQRPFTYGIFPLISMQEGNTSNAASPTGTTPNAICSTSDNHSGACPGATQPNPDLELQQVLVLALQHGANQIELGPCEIEAAFLTPCTGSYAASHPSTVAAYATAIQNAALGLPVQVSAAGGHGHGGGTGHFQ